MLAFAAWKWQNLCSVWLRCSTKIRASRLHGFERDPVHFNVLTAQHQDLLRKVHHSAEPRLLHTCLSRLVTRLGSCILVPVRPSCSGMTYCLQDDLLCTSSSGLSEHELA